MEKTPCYMIIVYDIEHVSAYLVDEPAWRWMHEGGPLPAAQAAFINEHDLSDIDEELAESDEEEAVYVRAHHVNGVFGPRSSSAGHAAPMTVSEAVRYARENGLDLVDAFTCECAY